MTPQSGDGTEEFPTPPQGTRMQVPTPPNGPARSRAIAVFSGVAGLIAGAAVTSGIWLLFGNEEGFQARLSEAHDGVGAGLVDELRDIFRPSESEVS